MDETTKKCPMCAEEIKIEATTCRFCGAQFEVTRTGYCQNCHEVRIADPEGRCKVCGNKVMDLRLESKFIEGPAQEPLPVHQPIAQTEITKTGRSRLPIGILAGILMLAVIGVVLWFGRNGVPAPSALPAAITPTATTTFTPTSTLTSTPTITLTSGPTRTPRPTPTATPDSRILNPSNQHLYLYVRERKDWHEARDSCDVRGGHLVTIDSPSENRFVYDLASDNVNTGTWLGATDEVEEGTWVWVTGEAWKYWNWAKVQNRVIDHDVSKSSDFMAFDFWDKTWVEWSEDIRFFVCEWEP